MKSSEVYEKKKKKLAMLQRRTLYSLSDSIQ